MSIISFILFKLFLLSSSKIPSLFNLTDIFLPEDDKPFSIFFISEPSGTGISDSLCVEITLDFIVKVDFLISISLCIKPDESFKILLFVLLDKVLFK